MGKLGKLVFLVAISLRTFSYCSETSEVKQVPAEAPFAKEPGLGVSTNPSTIDILTGTGEVGRWLFQSGEECPVRLGGVWVADGDVILTGGADLGKWSGNNLVVIGLNLDLEKLKLWKGGSFGAAFLQFNGMNSNGMAGSVQGFDSMPGPPPYNRTELYEVWFRQVFLDNKLIVRVGKTVPTYDFNNVLRPVPVQNKSAEIPAVSGLLYTPIFINPVNVGVMPGYYNSAYGITVNVAPIESYYVSLGAYDGNGARGQQTGLKGPHFNGYYFYVAETGTTWRAGKERKPGNIGLGAWKQTGKLSIPNVVETLPDIAEQKGCEGVYLFGAQRVWFRHPNIDESGISTFWQLGYNHAKTLPMNKFIGLGMTAFALTRPKDSFGFGLALSWLNQRLFTRKTELMLQGYYQAHLFHNTYLEPVISYIPTPGGGDNLPSTWTATVQMINLF